MLRQTPSLLMLFFSEMTSRRRMVHFLCKNLEIIWGTCIPESEEPVRGMARMCAAYSGIIFTGKTPFDDQLFTIAMLHDLLASYSPTVQALLSLLKMFFGSVKTERSHRTAGKDATGPALLGSARSNNSNRNQNWNNGQRQGQGKKQ
jgi:hypothetical protein